MTVAAPSVLALSAPRRIGEIDHDVARHEKIEVAIVVRVEERGAGRPPGFADAALRRDVTKVRASVSLEQRVVAEHREVEVLVPVAVRIADRDTHPVARERCIAGTRRAIREVRAPVVQEQAMYRALLAGWVDEAIRRAS